MLKKAVVLRIVSAEAVASSLRLAYFMDAGCAGLSAASMRKTERGLGRCANVPVIPYFNELNMPPPRTVKFRAIPAAGDSQGQHNLLPGCPGEVRNSGRHLSCQRCKKAT
jgi:hypothetical protein